MFSIVDHRISSDTATGPPRTQVSYLREWPLIACILFLPGQASYARVDDHDLSAARVKKSPPKQGQIFAHDFRRGQVSRMTWEGSKLPRAKQEDVLILCFELSLHTFIPRNPHKLCNIYTNTNLCCTRVSKPNSKVGFDTNNCTKLE